MGSVGACGSGMLNFLAVISLLGVLPECVIGNVVNGQRLLREPIILPGQCATNLPAVANLDLNRYQGRWYEVESITNGYLDGDCVASEYEITSSGVLGFYSTQVIDHNQQAIEGSAVLVGNGQFVITLVSDPSDPVISFNVIEYRILATDYDSYALGYSCSNIDNQTKRVYSWKLSRTTQLTQAAQSAIDAVIAQVDELNNSYYSVKDYSESACYVYPAVVQGQTVVLDGQCPSITQVPIVQNFDLQRFQGIWYDIESYYNSVQEGECVDNNFVSTGNGFTITGSQVLNRNLVNNYGSAYLVGTDGSARFELLYSDETDDTISFATTEYWVLATDYDSYSLVYSCSNVSPTSKAVFAWKFSRTRALSNAAQTAINAVMENILDLDNRFFFPKAHSYEECFYYPEPIPNQIVTFRGECQNVPSMQNFNVSNFLGTWSEISSYPTGAPSRGCVSYELSQTNAGLSVTRTQVIDGQFTTISGNIEWLVAEGRFNVTFNIGGNALTYPFWITDTDYVTYALGYSCIAAGNSSERKEVYSWKFGRDRILPVSSNTAISQAIAPILVLDERYYETVDQSGVACLIPVFPIEHEGNEVIYSGRCEDTNIPRVQDFNFNRFQGEWYDIALYYNPVQIGECNQVQYTIESNNVIEILKTQVVNGTQTSQTGKATLISTDGSAVFLVETANANEDSIISFTRSEYYVVATDYESYALLYSCTNLENNQRRIYSWKQSRTRQLTAAAEEAINNVISQIDVLDDQYFNEKDHSNEACLIVESTEAPEVPLGTVTVFPGQCDENIPVVLNIDLERYQGTWYDIEMYYNNAQTGECTAANYDYSSAGVLNFTNTQVLGGIPTSQTGVATLIPSANGSAKFEVVLANTDEDAVISFASVEYWILATDYDSYSLVYSCINQLDNTKIVYSWKQSRTRQLTDAARAAIDAVVATIEVLDDRYFQVKDHSDEACLIVIPSPDPDPTPAPIVPIPDTDEVIFEGQCDDNIPVVQNFDLNRYQGFWYDIEMYYNTAQTGQCTVSEYFFEAPGVLNFNNTQVVGGIQTSQTGVATLIPSADGSAKFEVALANTDDDSIISFARVEYWILATDYDSYSLVYSCTNLADNRRRVYSWKQSRTNQLSDAARQAIDAVVQTIDVLDDQYFQVKDHSDAACLIIEPFVPGDEIVLPGQCEDERPAVLQNYDPIRYLGEWYEVQSYPDFLEGGSCKRRSYGLTTDGLITLQSSYVSNQSLVAVEGSGIFVSSDGSGRLFATYNIPGPDGTEGFLTFEYWILATDYDSYSFAYSCQNVDANSKRIYSWKMSRTRQLTAAANTAINAIVDQYSMLNNDYYLIREHSEELCFYYPPVSDGEPVILEGQCSANVPAVTNFNIERFQGEWYSIEQYYSEFLDGDCNRATVLVGDDGTITVVKRSVTNGVLNSAFGTATIADPNQGGKLDVAFIWEDTDVISFIATQVSIIATDYDSYALLYACENVTPTTQRVYSWKFSRSQQLSAAAQTAINAAISQVNVLDERYYFANDQSEGACFTSLENLPGDTVTFSGQCNPYIPVVQNFDAVRYMGNWFDIESYPERFQFGTCPTATYNLNEAGFVEVYNTQIVDRNLDEIYGTAVVASDDGSAKLTVTFPVAGTNLTVDAPYWVLATDYDNYALVYSCINLDAERYQVTSWKLSRETTLSAASEAAINLVVNAYPDLDNSFYNVRGHSNSDCLYYPEINGGPVILRGTCEDQNSVLNFNGSAFTGTWYEDSRYPSQYQIGDCSSTEVQIENSLLTISYSIVNDGNLITFDGLANVGSDGSFFVAITNSNGEIVFLPLSILDTDYTSYALLYSCMNLGNQGGGLNRKQVFSWKLSRSREGLSNQANQNIGAIIENVDDLYAPYYRTSDQGSSACLYYPEFGPDADAIILPGTCSENIQAVPNFDAGAYLGLWFEISSYPVPSQDINAQCSRAEYSLNNSGVVDVFNTLVINQTLNIQTGVAVVASTDGSGILDVTFVLSNGAVVNANYYIMATDYNNYALVYSCRNVGEFSRQVSSWVLSRERTLANQYYSIINPVINATEGLREEYYRPTSQSDEDCFYVPELDITAPVIFNGQCEDVTGVQGFDIARYAGWWHEIEAYPTGVVDGTCTSSRIQSSNNQYLAVDTTVFGLGSNVTTSTLTASTNGRIVKTSNGVSTELWVLATDYETYSVLYSCENINALQRRVWSAIHSKTRTLSPIASLSVQEVLASNQVLISDLYVPVDQSDDGCFHYPEITGDRVIIPGQCDNNIPVVQNFDVARYGGTWYQIEKYPQQWESGTCVGARYRLNEATGVVDVLNWQVIDGVLDEIEGTAVLISTDGSAKLLVTLPVLGTQLNTTFELFVLTTDYESYSLAYSCENVNQYERSIGAWKLSRSRTLAAADAATINNVINQRPELHTPYFVVTEQNEDCDEPSSGHVLSSSLLVILFCAILQRLY